MPSDRLPNVLFLCTGNSCRSQMAEGFARHLLADKIHAYSAGVDPHGMNPRAMKVMAEAAAPIDTHTSKHVDSLKHVAFDVVVAVCGHADEACPAMSGPAKRIFHGFEDPPKLARDARTEEESIAHYRRVRDEIRRYVVDSLLADIEAATGLRGNHV